MSWMARLYETYEHVKGLGQDTGPRLMPICHTLQNAHINIVIDGDGNFQSAYLLKKKQVMLPATEKSAGRSSGEAPHPLADKIQYVAGDYAKYGGLKKAYFPGYKKQLTQWNESEFGNVVTAAVLSYVAKETVVADLIKHQILHEKDGVLLTQWDSKEPAPDIFSVLPKEKGILDQGSALVCWTVNMPGVNQADTWENREIQQSWIDFDSRNGGRVGLCFVKGENAVLATNHPAKIRHTGDKAKLVSANDGSGFTFRGRLLNDDQANAVSFDVTQKAHNALRWLVERQRHRNGDQVFVSWAINGKALPEPLMDPFDIAAIDYSEEQQDHSKDAGAKFAQTLNKYLQGYIGKDKLQADDSIIIMGIDSATPGRMSVIYYRETFAQEFIDTLEKWHWDLAWLQRNKIKIEVEGKKPIEKVVWAICAPTPYKVWSAVYGDVIKSNENLKKNLIERLMPCVVEARPIPWDIVQNCVRRVTNRMSYKADETWLWEQNLGIACALYKGYCKRTKDKTKQKEYAMALDTETTSRDYLYGRLLATAESIESFALSKADEKRSTTAERFMQRFADRPFSTWRTIEMQIRPYKQRLQVKFPNFFESRERLLDEIFNKFDDQDFTSDKPLSGEFLLGFHCQRTVLKAKKPVEDVSELEVNP